MPKEDYESKLVPLSEQRGSLKEIIKIPKRK